MAPGDETYISPWHKGVLIPFWVLQLLALLNVMGVCGGGISASETDAVSYYYSLGDGDAVASFSATIAVCIVSKALIITEIILFPRHKLREVIYFAFQITRMSLWTCLMIFQIFVCTQPFYTLATFFWASFGVSFIIWALFLGTLIYGSVIFHRYRIRNKVGRNHAPIYVVKDPPQLYQNNPLPQPVPVYVFSESARQAYQNKPVPTAGTAYVVNEQQQAYQMPNNINPISPAYISHLAQLAAINHPEARALANSGQYPQIQVIYNYGPPQSQARPGQGQVVEGGDRDQNSGTGNISTPQKVASSSGDGTAYNRRPLPSTVNHSSNRPVSEYDYSSNDVAYN